MHRKMKFFRYILTLTMLLATSLAAAQTATENNSCSHASQALGIFAIFLLLIAIAALARARRFKQRATQVAKELENAKQGAKGDEQKIHELEESVVEAKEAATAKSRFLATMSHEIRTPLNAIIGFADFLDQPDVPPEKQREYAKSLNTVANALLALINDILDLSKLDSGNTDTMNLQQGATEFSKLFTEMQTVFQLKAVQKGLTLSFDIEKDIPCLTVLEPRVRQILLNIIGNAIKYTLTGSVAVKCNTVRCPEEGFLDVIIVVQDTGIGISPAGLKRIFDPFSQDIESRQGKVFLGTGLGLAIVKRLVDASGGSITCESTLGQGSKFTITLPHLPIHEPLEKPVDTATAAAKIQTIKKVLIVDDIAMNRKILGMYLKSLGISDMPDFGNAKEALQYLNSNTADIILSDMWMPGMNGLEFAKEVKKINPNIPIVAVTADVDVGASFDTSVFDDILTKPITSAKLKELFAKIGK